MDGIAFVGFIVTLVLFAGLRTAAGRSPAGPVFGLLIAGAATVYLFAL